MMLRTTISRIRKVCSLGFVPRVLRDDLCNVPAAYAVIRKAHKSTKSTDDGPGPTEEGTDSPILKTTSVDTKIGIPLTHRERCQKIIDQAFGSGTTEPDRVMSEQYFSNTVNIEDTRREIQEAEKARIKLQEQNMKMDNPFMRDDRQYGIFKMSRELIKDDEDEDGITVEEDTRKKSPHTDTLTQKDAASPVFTEEGAKPHILSANEELENPFNMASDRETQVQTAPLKEPNLDCAKVDHYLNISNPVTSDTVGNKAALYDGAETVNRDKNDTNPAGNPDHNQVLNVTTAKEKEEILAQKLETIEETPLVEAQRPGIEGFNVNPKVLGDQLNPALTCKSINKKQGNSPGGDIPGTLDEVAKRCLNSPLGQIDELLVKEMEKIGIPLTCKTENKTPSTVMGDELVQMDPCNEKKQQSSHESDKEDKEEERGNMIITGPSSIHHTFTEVRLPDLNEQPDEMTLLKSEDFEPVEEETILHPDLHKKEIKPFSGDDNPTAKFSCHRSSELDKDGIEEDHHISQLKINQTIYRRSELDEDEIEEDRHISPSQELKTNQTIYRRSELDEDEIEEDRHISPSQETKMNQTIQKKIEPNHELSQYGYARPNVQQTAPDVTATAPSDRGSMQALHSSIFKQITERFSQGLNDKNVLVQSKQAADRTPDTSEAIKPAIKLTFNPANVSPFHPLSHTPGNKSEGLFKPEYNSYYKGVRTPSHYGTINASHLAEHDQRPLAERVENKNPYYSHYLSSTYAPRQAKEPTATESEEVECYSQTPEFEPKTIEEQAVLDERRNAANRLVERVPFTKISTPDQNWDRNIENSPNEDKVIQPCSNKLHSDLPEPEKVTLPEELMKEHELDPYYVLTCNETCPISPGPSMSACRNSDFVDTTDTIYMKKNICESLRPKPIAENLVTPFENVIANTRRSKLDVKSLMTQYENLTAETQAKINENIYKHKNISDSEKPKYDAKRLTQYYENGADTQAHSNEIIHKNKIISESVQRKLDATSLVTPQCENVSADTQAQLNEVGEAGFELAPKSKPKIKVKDTPDIKPSIVFPEPRSLPNTQQVTLTELLKRVRERSRTKFISDLGVKVASTEGKCNRRAPRCMPTAPRSPPMNPIPPPSFGLPMVKRRPEVCKPKKKGGGCSKKCAACDIDVTCGVKLGEICPKIACELNEAEACAAISRVDLAEVVFEHIQMLGKIVSGVLRQVKSNFETLFARQYDPWSPIPSWPIPKKVEKPKWTPGYSGVPPCVKGCPVFPKARASMNPEPPCNLKPCKGFPKRRSFSALDCFAVYLGDNKVYDLGQF